MCHPEVPAGQPTPTVERDEVRIPLPGGEAMPALHVRPEAGQGGAVLLVADVYGPSPFYEDLAARLGTAGFHALLPDYFFREGVLPERTRELAMRRAGELDQRRTLEDLGAALEWLGAQPGAEGPRRGTIGFCMGGTLVLDLAARHQNLATVCFYGFPAGSAAPRPKGPPAPLEETERMTGPILGFWGDQDAGVGMDNVKRLADALAVRGVDFEHTVYPGLGHGFMAASQLDPAHEAYEAACDAWTRTVAFYRAKLGSG
jgi:carboxymethylenebutenolidase